MPLHIQHLDPLLPRMGRALVQGVREAVVMAVNGVQIIGDMKIAFKTAAPDLGRDPYPALVDGGLVFGGKGEDEHGG